MTLNVALGETYVPTWNGNDKSERPIKFKLKYLTAAERESVAIFWTPVGATKRGVSVKTDMSEAFRLGVESIENLNVMVDGKEIAVRNAADFLKFPMPVELYQEVALRIRDTTGIDAKN